MFITTQYTQLYFLYGMPEKWILGSPSPKDLACVYMKAHLISEVNKCFVAAGNRIVYIFAFMYDTVMVSDFKSISHLQPMKKPPIAISQ